MIRAWYTSLRIAGGLGKSTGRALEMRHGRGRTSEVAGLFRRDSGFIAVAPG